jgi:large subunit ribosomal protein L5
MINQKLEKIVINVGIGRFCQQPNFEDKIIPAIKNELSLITGQAPAYRVAKKSVAGFKIKAGDIVGLQVTLRGRKMNDFLTRLINIALPRVKDFKGLNLKNIDQNGNLNIGLREQYVFPEIKAEESKFSFGLQITLVPNFRDREKAVVFYRSLGVPLKEN